MIEWLVRSVLRLWATTLVAAGAALGLAALASSGFACGGQRARRTHRDDQIAKIVAAALGMKDEHGLAPAKCSANVVAPHQMMPPPATGGDWLLEQRRKSAHECSLRRPQTPENERDDHENQRCGYRPHYRCAPNIYI